MQWPNVLLAVFRRRTKREIPMALSLGCESMGRTKGFKKDRLYITRTEWVNEYGGKKTEPEARPFKSLQYTHCATLLLLFSLNRAYNRSFSFVMSNLFHSNLPIQVDPLSASTF